ncbi:prefoldin subunit 3-like [Gigantopelta aegis]|uniref:prefoldin subunit 3-like n=1 Tax=Gigantopelta aegis TaxID=1735272 RepID=UPI001B887720|nr:prefoldin subunit 3-like [Gigantopelta aegis]
MATEASSNELISQSGIPQAEFVEDVEEFMKRLENSESAENVLRRLDELHSKYKFMEYNLNTKKARLKGQIPDITTTLGIVKHLQSKKDSTEPLETRFLLSDQVYAKASIPPTDKVCLWLGANVMLEYNLDDAQVLLEKNLTTAKKTLSQVDDDLSFLRDQTTTLEVNMARVYNWDVKRRQATPSVKS